MHAKRRVQWIVVVAILVVSLATTGSAFAGADCYGYVTVQPGDTLSSIASMCGTTVEAIQAANPGMGASVQAGQVLNIPTGYMDSQGYFPPPSGTGVQAYYPPAYIQPTYYPNAPYPSMSYPPAPPWSQLRGLKVTYKYGLIVRSGPGRYFDEIAGPYVSAVKNSTWTYIKNSTVVDRQGFVWVQVKLPRVVGGYSTGWIVVKDGLGNYYTRPNIDP